MITEPQKGLIRKLVADKDISPLPDAQIDFLTKGEYGRMSKEQADRCIKILLKCDKRTVMTTVGKYTDIDVQDGYFFIIDPTDDTEKFFRVNHGKENTRWEGKLFLSVQASDYFYPVKNPEHRKAVLEQIALDPVTAMNEYGIRLGRCGVCNRTLTDRDSRLRGIGPICARRFISKEDEFLIEQFKLLSES